MITWEYIAGFFDGEGCVGWYQRCHVSMSQAEPQHEVVYLIDEFLCAQGLKVNVIQTPPGRGRKRQSILHVLSITNQESVGLFLEGVMPYLIVKKEQAVEVLELVKARLETRSNSHWRSSLMKFPDAKVQKMYRQWRNGMSQANIGKEHGLTQHQVSRLFRMRSGVLQIQA